MKKIIGLIVIVTALVFAFSCSNEKGRYIDLRTGKTVRMEKDPQTGLWVDATTKQPVYIYVDSKNGDTIYGKTGVVINGHVRRGSDNIYWYDADMKDNGYEVKNDNYKVEVEKDGDVKIKDGDKKTKIDGKTGEKKTKND
jgi:hypothetical protein